MTLWSAKPIFAALSPHTGSAVTIAEDDGIKTQLYKLTTSVSFSYVNPAWKMFLRKEVQFMSRGLAMAGGHLSHVWLK